MIISLVNQKGGVTKTTSAINIGASLSFLGHRVLLVDLDPQSNCTSGVGFNSEGENNIFDVLTFNKDINSCIHETGYKNLYILPSIDRLANVEQILVNEMDRERILRNELKKIENDYDFIFLDCPPSLGLITLNALVASDKLLIPMLPKLFAFEGLTLLLNTYKKVKIKINKDLDILGSFFCYVDKRTNIEEYRQELKDIFKDKFFDSIVYQYKHIADSQEEGTPLCYHNRSSKGSREYFNLAKEILEHAQTKE